jgi:hypothetical protein
MAAITFLLQLTKCSGRPLVTDPSEDKKPAKPDRPGQVKKWRMPRHAMSIGAMGGALALVALVFLTYDLAKGKLSPCDAIFQESSLGLSTRISFLKTEGELQIGREKLTDLDERAQMAALNLKTCCTVLDAGRVDPEQFLQCKGKARAYEAQLGDIADLVRKAVKEGITTSSIAAADAAPAPAPPVIQAKIDEEVKAAKEISREFNREVVQVRKEQAVERLKAVPPRNVAIEAQESEPNNDMLTTNSVPLAKWITGAVEAGDDSDYFVFTTPKTHRDRIQIELQNRSTTLEPRIRLYDAEKTSLGDRYKTTNGADMVYSFIAPPETTYIARVSNYYGKSTGVYLLRVVATKAYDAHEPNGDILHAKPIEIGNDVDASIMDGGDADYFKIVTGDEATPMLVSVANTSTTLRPQITLFARNKATLGQQYNTTDGGDISYAFEAEANATYYIRVRDYYGKAAGSYTLNASEKPPGDG